MSRYYYDRNGRSITMSEWAEMSSEHMVVEKTQVPEADAEVSTVWLGMDHSWGDDGPPIIFETMVFGGVLDQAQQRYATEAEAKAGHAAMVARAKSAQRAIESVANDSVMRPALKNLRRAIDRLHKDFDLYDNDRTVRLLLQAATE